MIGRTRRSYPAGTKRAGFPHRATKGRAMTRTLPHPGLFRISKNDILFLLVGLVAAWIMVERDALVAALASLVSAAQSGIVELPWGFIDIGNLVLVLTDNPIPRLFPDAGTTGAITPGRNVIIAAATLLPTSALYTHELTHIEQIRALPNAGFFSPLLDPVWLWDYTVALIKYGYYDNPYEVAARAIASV